MLDLSRMWLLSFFVPFAVAQQGPTPWQPLTPPTQQSLRGLAVVDAKTLWVGGAAGSLWRTTDGGASWHDVAPKDATACDFRDVEAFSAEVALAMVAGQPARLYRTTDAGRSWTVVLQDERKEAFFDGIAFAGDHGVLFGDPIDGAFEIFTSHDRGASWQREAKERLPVPLAGEAAFAASGTCVAVTRVGDQPVFFVGTGGGARSRLLRGSGGTWSASDLPLPAGAASRGAFGLAPGAHGVVAVGGDYAAPAVAAGTAAFGDSFDAMRVADDGAGGFRSAAVWLSERDLLAVGSHGTSLSADRGATWRPVSDLGFHALGSGSDGSVFACGADGRVARWRGIAQPLSVQKLFGDHMVLPPSTTVPMRGRGTAGAEVAVDASWGKQVTARIASDGTWSCALPTPDRGGPFTLTVASDGETLRIVDVLAGDVWLASGQSNMEMELGKHGWSPGVRDYERELASANHPQLRCFTVAKNAADTPADDVVGEWVVCSPATAAPFSAVAYFFARDLMQAGKGPLGIVVSSWGGTVCEAWASPPGLAAFPEFGGAKPGSANPAREQRRLAFWDAIERMAPSGPAVDVQVPGSFSATGLADFDGVVQYERRLDLPAGLRGKDSWLELGAIDDMDVVYWGAEQLAASDDDGVWDRPRRYRVPAAWTDRATVDLRIRVVDTGGEGGFTGAPATLRLVAGDVAVPLAGSWRRTVHAPISALPRWPARAGGPNRPSVLWNGMIAPLVPFPFTGAIWYQGESNRARHEQYARLFPAMIEDWRRAFGTPLPFFFVQIAPFGYGDEGEGRTALLREAQAAALALPRTGMAVTLDCGDARDIHPTWKQPVGSRLAALARARHYGEPIPCEGPRAIGVTANDDSLVVTFATSHGPVQLVNDGAGFELAGADGKFVPARARLDGGTVVVRADGLKEPKHVRYAWAAVPRWSITEADGFPGAPFRLSLP